MCRPCMSSALNHVISLVITLLQLRMASNHGQWLMYETKLSTKKCFSTVSRSRNTVVVVLGIGVRHTFWSQFLTNQSECNLEMFSRCHHPVTTSINILSVCSQTCLQCTQVMSGFLYEWQHICNLHTFLKQVYNENENHRTEVYQNLCESVYLYTFLTK